MVYCIVASFVLLLIFLIVGSSDSGRDFVFKEICHNSGNLTNITLNDKNCINGEIFNTTANQVPTKLQQQSILLQCVGYIPSLAFYNVFAVFYFEVISMTKLIAGKSKSDSDIGFYVNTSIFSFYFALFLIIFIYQISTNSKDQQPLEVLMIKQMYTMDNPLDGQLKTSLTVFDLNQVLLSTILFIHCLTNLFIAKESGLIYYDELKNQRLSQQLDSRNNLGNTVNQTSSE